jgi:hypothetical protein
MTGKEQLQLFATAKTMKELTMFKRKFHRNLDSFVVILPNKDELEWEDIP